MDTALIADLLKKYPMHINGAGNIITCVGRLSFPALDKPRKMEGSAQEPKYQATLLFPLGADLSVLMNAIVEAAKTQFPKLDLSKGWPENMKRCLKKQDDKAEKYSGYTAGAFMLSGNAGRRPGLVDAQGVTVADPERFYPGCWVRASVKIYGYDKGGGKGVGCQMNNLQFIADDVRFDGGTRAGDDFGAVEGVPAPVAAANAPAASSAPASSMSW